MPSAARGRLPPARLWPRRARARGGGTRDRGGPGTDLGDAATHLRGPPDELPQTSETPVHSRRHSYLKHLLNTYCVPGFPGLHASEWQGLGGNNRELALGSVAELGVALTAAQRSFAGPRTPSGLARPKACGAPSWRVFLPASSASSHTCLPALGVHLPLLHTL